MIPHKGGLGAESDRVPVYVAPAVPMGCPLVRKE